MKIRVLFFGATADAVGKREEVLDLEGQPILAVVAYHVKSSYPAIASSKLLFSLNQEYADLEQELSDGDEVAIFTPVSGG